MTVVRVLSLHDAIAGVGRQAALVILLGALSLDVVEWRNVPRASAAKG